MLTPEARKSFETQGYARVRNALSPSIVVQLRSALERLCRPEALLEGETFFENSDEIRGASDGSAMTTFGDHQLRISNLQKRDVVFHQLVDHEAVLPFVLEYMESPRLAGDWHIQKSIGPRSSWWHRGHGNEGFVEQDGKVRTKALNVAWFLDDQRSGEGCLLCLPGSHKMEFDGLTKNTISNEFPGLSLEGSIEVEGNAGDCVVFSEALFHCGDEKLRGGTRRNLYTLYQDLSFEEEGAVVICIEIDEF